MVAWPGGPTGTFWQLLAADRLGMIFPVGDGDDDVDADDEDEDEEMMMMVMYIGDEEEENFCDIVAPGEPLGWSRSEAILKGFLGTIPTLLRSSLLSIDKLNFLDTRRKICFCSRHPALSVETLPFSVHHMSLLN